MYGPSEVDERFDGPDLDPVLWIDSYLPAWSSRAESKAVYAIDERGLRLSIPADQPLWCPGLHDGPLRVSSVQTGNWSGPVGGTRGQQPFREGVVVREEQPTHCGFTPHFGRRRGRVPRHDRPALDVLGVDGRPGGPARAVRRDLPDRGVR